MINSGKVEESIFDQVTIFSPSVDCFISIERHQLDPACSGVDDGNVWPVCDFVEGHVPDRLVSLLVLLPEYKVLPHDRFDSLVTPEVSVEDLALEFLSVLKIKTSRSSLIIKTKVSNLNVDEEPALSLVCVVPGCLPVALVHQVQGRLKQLLQSLLLRLGDRQALLQPVLHVASLGLEISEAVEHTANSPLLQRLVDSVVHHVAFEAWPHHHLGLQIYQ